MLAMKDRGYGSATGYLSRDIDGSADRPINPITAVLDAVQRWQSRAREGQWLLAVYFRFQEVQVDVLQLQRVHLNDQRKLRLEGQLMRQTPADPSRITVHGLLDVPVDKLLWYEVINPIELDNIPIFEKIMGKGARIREVFEADESLTSAHVAHRRPR